MGMMPMPVGGREGGREGGDEIPVRASSIVILRNSSCLLTLFISPLTIKGFGEEEDSRITTRGGQSPSLLFASYSRS